METKSRSWNEASYGEATVDLSESLFSHRWDKLSPFNVVPSHLFQEWSRSFCQSTHSSSHSLKNQEE